MCDNISDHEDETVLYSGVDTTETSNSRENGDDITDFGSDCNSDYENVNISFSSIEYGNAGDDQLYNEDEPSTPEISGVQFSSGDCGESPEVSQHVIRENEEENEGEEHDENLACQDTIVCMDNKEEESVSKNTNSQNKNKKNNKNKNKKGYNNNSKKNTFVSQSQKKPDQGWNKKHNISNNSDNKQSKSKNNYQNNSSKNDSQNNSFKNSNANNSYQNASKSNKPSYNSKNSDSSNNNYKNNAGNSSYHNANKSNNNNNTVSQNYNKGNSEGSGNSNIKKDKGDNGNKNERTNKPDILKEAKSVLRRIKKHGQNKLNTVDSFVLRMHYCIGVCVFLLAYNVVQGNWFLRESIHCVEAFNADAVVSSHKKSICLSYPYTCEPPHATRIGGNKCKHRYHLFYKWIHYSFLVISAVYYTPRILAKGKHPQLGKLLSDLLALEQKYDSSSMEKACKLALQYFKSHGFVHFSLYARMVFTHLYALAIDLVTVIFFDFMLHDGFIGLIYTTYPWKRNPRNFNDSMSFQFPPYAFCTIDKHYLINSGRTDHYGCHLTLMELYEKVFIALWFLLAVVTTFTAISVFVLLLLWIPPFNQIFLHTTITSPHLQRVKKKVLKICGVGDLYTLYLLKKHMNQRHFIVFLDTLVQAHEDSLKEVLVDS